MVFLNGEPAAGDLIHLRHYRRYAVEGLDGAASTTVPASAEHLLVVGAAAHALLVRARQLSENPAVPEGAGGALLKLAGIRLQEFRAGLERIAYGDTRLVWGDVGL